MLASKKLKSSGADESVKVKIQTLVQQQTPADGVQADLLGIAEPNAVYAYYLEVEVQKIELGVHAFRDYGLKLNYVVVALFAVVHDVLARFGQNLKAAVFGAVAHKALQMVLHHQALAGVDGHTHANGNVFNGHARSHGSLAYLVEQNQWILAFKSLKGHVAGVAVVLVALNSHGSSTAHVESAQKQPRLAGGPAQLVKVNGHVVVAVAKGLDGKALVGPKHLEFATVWSVLDLDLGVVKRILGSQAEREGAHLGGEAGGPHHKTVCPKGCGQRRIPHEFKGSRSFRASGGKKISAH